MAGRDAPPLFGDWLDRAAPIGFNLQSESSHATPVYLLLYHELQESHDSQSEEQGQIWLYDTNRNVF